LVDTIVGATMANLKMGWPDAYCRTTRWSSQIQKDRRQAAQARPRNVQCTYAWAWPV